MPEDSSVPKKYLSYNYSKVFRLAEACDHTSILDVLLRNLRTISVSVTLNPKLNFKNC